MAEPALTFPPLEAQRLESHLPPSLGTSGSSQVGSLSTSLPFVTLTFATSLDSALSLGPGIRTALSGPQSKAMTHYLRSRHDAICVGVGTAIADNPGLNCRLAAAANKLPPIPPALGTAGVGNLLDLPNISSPETNSTVTTNQPRPIVIDPSLRWDFSLESKVMQLAKAGKGLAPYIVTTVLEPPAGKQRLLEDLGGKFLVLDQTEDSHASQGRDRGRLDWRTILAAVRREGLQSIMIEGGGEVINSLLAQDGANLVDSVIITIAPTWLGQGSVYVSPPRKPSLDNVPAPVARLTNAMWMPLGEDVVLCGRLAQ
ncbi:putative riboflavin biosynthesis protein Rib7 [Xylariomycetidae sp. FL2044]|nr:putative riboflavin biosynthesis protein Rib7 [Xylariomycetidae sp. FL2044]